MARLSHTASHRPSRARTGAGPCARAKKRGFSLIEVLVGLLLFSFGVLGLVGLQASMTEGQSVSKFRTDAAFLANELIGVMWADVAINVGNLASYTTSGCDGVPHCADWKAKLSAQLPQGTLVELTPSTAGATAGDVKISIKWTMPNGSSHTYTTTANVSPA